MVIFTDEEVKRARKYIVSLSLEEKWELVERGYGMWSHPYRWDNNNWQVWDESGEEW